MQKQGQLQDIPEDWNTKNLQELAIGSISNGFFKKPDLVGEGYRLVNVSDLYQEFGIDLSLVKG